MALDRGLMVPGVSTTWTIGQWSTRGGRFSFAGDPPMNLINQFCSSLPPNKVGPNTFAQCLAQHGYTQLTSYQPASRFWPFQWIEGGWSDGDEPATGAAATRGIWPVVVPAATTSPANERTNPSGGERGRPR